MVTSTAESPKSISASSSRICGSESGTGAESRPASTACSLSETTIWSPRAAATRGKPNDVVELVVPAESSAVVVAEVAASISAGVASV